MTQSFIMRRNLLTTTVLCGVIIALNACTNISERKASTRSIKDGGPATPVDVSHIPDPTPRPVFRTTAGNKSPYVVFGKSYTVLADSDGFRQQGDASWYGTKFHGRRTSNGEIYNMYAMTAAHKTLPIPSYVKVTNLANQRSVIVRVNDRGPFHSDRIIDLSYAAAKKLGYVEVGVASVMVEDVTPKANTAVLTANQSADHSPAIPAVENTVDSSELSATTSTTSAYLQMGAFRELQSAEALRAKLEAIVKYPVAIARSYDAWYRVRIGPVHTEQSLAYLSDDLQRRGHNKPLVVYE